MSDRMVRRVGEVANNWQFIGEAAACAAWHEVVYQFARPRGRDGLATGWLFREAPFVAQLLQMRLDRDASQGPDATVSIGVNPCHHVFKLQAFAA